MTQRGHAPGDAEKRRKKRGPRFYAAMLGLFLVANPCTIAIVIRVALYEAFEIAGPAGAPNYQDGDRVVVQKYAYGFFPPLGNGALFSWGEPQVGDVVIARSPHDGVDIIKRVVAVGGDTVAIEDDVLHINGVPVERTRIGQARGGENPMTCFHEALGGDQHTILQHDLQVPDFVPATEVPDGHVYLLGDNRDRSADSRLFGAVPVSAIKGRVGSHYHLAPQRITCPD